MAKKIEATITAETTTEAPATVFDYAGALVTHKTKSGVIRALHSEGMDTKTIYGLLSKAGVMNEAGTQPIRYQHVRNVLVTQIKKA